MDSLKDFILSGCKKVKKLPEFGENMTNLSSIDLQDCKSLVCLPKSIHNVKSLKNLNLQNCKSLVCLPKSFHKVKSLKFLNIVGCSKLSMLPENLGGNEALEELDVRGTAIKEVPSSIILLKGLKKFSIGGHKEKESNSWSLSAHPSRLMFWRVPVSTSITLPSMSGFSCLEVLDLSYCNLSNESLPDGLGCLSSLLQLDLSGNNFSILPASIADLSKLYHLGLDCCPKLESVPVLPPQIGSLYGRNSVSWNPFSDPQYLCDFFSSHQQVRSAKYTLRQQEEPCLFIEGSNIPPWFTNQNYFHLDLPCNVEYDIGDAILTRTLSDLPNQTLTSIIVDIPDYCLSSEWWGIAVCLVLENPFPSVPWSVTPIVFWNCKSAEAESSNATGDSFSRVIEEFNDPHLLILLLRCTYCSFLLKKKNYCNIGTIREKL